LGGWPPPKASRASNSRVAVLASQSRS
jgi:hypothetical protein